MIERETYTELVHAMIFAIVKQQLSLTQASSVLWACAQPTTTEETFDVTHEVREALTDWSQLDKGMLIAIETVQMTFECNNIHGPCKRGKHAVQMTRVIGSQDWEPESVSSSLNFNEVILGVTAKHHPNPGPHNVATVASGMSDLIGAFRDMFLEQPEQIIDKEIDQFRAELDALFPSAPSNPQQGKEEGHESA